MQAVLLIQIEVTVALNHSAESQKYAGSRPLVVHGEGGKPCSIPHLETPIQQALNLIPDVLICIVWGTVYMPISGETCSCLLFDVEKKTSRLVPLHTFLTMKQGVVVWWSE